MPQAAASLRVPGLDILPLLGVLKAFKTFRARDFRDEIATKPQHHRKHYGFSA
ncbi:MAG: hypothetical protein ACFCU8_15220 [Thermosynechococcaceae cyanobacterium]